MYIKKSDLAEKLARLRSVIPGRTAISGIQGVLIKGNTATARNHEICITAILPEETKKPFILPTRAIDMIDSMPDGRIELDVLDNHRVYIETSGIQNTFSSYDPKEFTEPETLPNAGKTVKIESSRLHEIVSSVLYAASLVETRPVYTGALFEAKNGELNVVTVDGYRAAWNKAAFDGDFRFITPRVTLDKLLRLGITGGIEIVLGERNAIFKSEDYTIYTRLLCGEFMDYRRVFPVNYKHVITVDRKAFLDGIARIIICIDEKLRTPAMMSFTNQFMTMSVRSSIADYTEDIGIIGTPDTDLKIGFNACYLRDAARSYNSESITMAFGTAGQPMLMSDGDLLSMILPVRMAEPEL